MKAATKISLAFVQTPATKLLVGRILLAIPAESYAVLRRHGDSYCLEIFEQSGDQTDPVVLASFLSPGDVDAAEAFAAASLSLEATRSKQKPAKRRKVATHQKSTSSEGHS